jgi:predicted N-acyltransferase
MKRLQFIWWVVNDKGFKNFDSYLALSNRKREQLWEEFNKLKERETVQMQEN